MTSESNQGSGRRLVYIFTDVPTQSGTFAHAEIVEMASRGFAVELICLRSQLTKSGAAEEIQALFPVRRSAYLSFATMRAMIRMLLRHPVRFIGATSRAILDTAGQPRILVKTLAILPKVCLFAEEIERHPPALLHAFWASLPGRAAWWLSHFSGVPYTVWAHAGADIYNRKHQTPGALVTILSGARTILTCNRANLEHFDRVLSGPARARVRLHGHGVDLTRFRLQSKEVHSGPLRVLSVGRLTMAKGFQVAIDACGLLQTRGRNVQYRIIGEGPLRDTLVERANAEGFTGLELLGSVVQSELPGHYGWADIFLAPSVIGASGARDGLPNVLLEAMACGVACVGSDTVGIPEAIEHDVTGMLVPPDDPEQLAQTIIELSQSESTRARLGTAAHHFVKERFDRGASMDRLAGYLQAAMD